MRTLIKILLRIIVVFAFLFSTTYVFVRFLGKPIVVEQLEQLTHKKVSLGDLSLALPFRFEIKDLNIEGMARAESISVSPSIPYLIIGNLAFNNISIVKPQISFERTAPVQIQESLSAAGAQAAVKTAATPLQIKTEPENKRPGRLIFKRFTVKDGEINFIDYTVKPEGVKITLKDINLNLTNLYTFPFPTIANFELKARIPWRQGNAEGKINAEGWFNFYKRDMQATINIQDIDGIYLGPYYSNWIDLEKARIEKANLNFTSNIQGLNNNVTAECHLELTDIVRKPRPPEEPVEKTEKVTNLVLDTLKELDQGKIVLNFNIKTKMDRPEFGIGNIRMAFEDRIAQLRAGTGVKPEHILMLPAKILEGGVKGATDLTKAVIDGTFAVGKEIKNAVEDSFTRQPKMSK
jgi:hypothetical protein